MTVTVTAKEDLESAQKRGENAIIVTGELARQVRRSRRLVLLSGILLTCAARVLGLLALAAWLNGAPVPGTAAGHTLGLGPTPVPADATAIVICALLGMGLLFHLHADYKIVESTPQKLVLRRRHPRRV